MFSVIFDMDGTLLDTQRICVDAWEFAGRAQGVKGLGEHVSVVCGMNEAGWLGYVADNFKSIDPAEFKAVTRRYIMENGKVEFMPGAVELLDFLEANGIKFAIASGSSRESIIHHLTELGVLDKFPVFVGGRDVVNGKPAPDIFLMTAEKMGVRPEDCFVFEDSANGIRAGYKAGMKCIGIEDMTPFPDDVKELMFTQLDCLSDAIDIFKEYL